MCQNEWNTNKFMTSVNSTTKGACENNCFLIFGFLEGSGHVTGVHGMYPAQTPAQPLSLLLFNASNSTTDCLRRIPCPPMRFGPLVWFNMVYYGYALPHVFTWYCRPGMVSCGLVQYDADDARVEAPMTTIELCAATG